MASSPFACRANEYGFLISFFITGKGKSSIQCLHLTKPRLPRRLTNLPRRVYKVSRPPSPFIFLGLTRKFGQTQCHRHKRLSRRCLVSCRHWRYIFVNRHCRFIYNDILLKLRFCLQFTF